MPGGENYIWEDLVTYHCLYLFLPPDERLLLLPDDLVAPDERLPLELGAAVLLEGEVLLDGAAVLLEGELLLDGAAVLLLGGVDLDGLVVDRLGWLLGGV